MFESGNREPPGPQDPTLTRSEGDGICDRGLLGRRPRRRGIPGLRAWLAPPGPEGLTPARPARRRGSLPGLRRAARAPQTLPAQPRSAGPPWAPARPHPRPLTLRAPAGGTALPARGGGRGRGAGRAGSRGRPPLSPAVTALEGHGGPSAGTAHTPGKTDDCPSRPLAPGAAAASAGSALRSGPGPTPPPPPPRRARAQPGQRRRAGGRAGPGRHVRGRWGRPSRDPAGLLAHLRAGPGGRGRRRGARLPFSAAAADGGGGRNLGERIRGARTGPAHGAPRALKVVGDHAPRPLQIASSPKDRGLAARPVPPQPLPPPGPPSPGPHDRPGTPDPGIQQALNNRGHCTPHPAPLPRASSCLFPLSGREFQAGALSLPGAPPAPSRPGLRGARAGWEEPGFLGVSPTRVHTQPKKSKRSFGHQRLLTRSLGLG